MSRADATFVRHLREIVLPCISSWPVDEYGDSIDTENLIVIRVSEGGVEFCCGGDWQEPRRMLLLHVAGSGYRVREVEGETCFPDIEVDGKSLQGLEEWLEAAEIELEVTDEL